jgi:hypothetical protein
MEARRTMAHRILPGMKVRIAEGSGIDSGRLVRVAFPSEVPIRKDGTGIPDITGHYQRVDFRQQAAIKFEDGRIDTMWLNRLIQIK